MNRMQFKGHSPDTLSPSAPEVHYGLLTQSRSCKSPHSLFAPMHYEPNYAYPLLVWLHGGGGDERQLQRVMPLISMRNYAAVAPRGTQKTTAGASGFEWGDSQSAVTAAAQRVFECLEAAQEKFNIARHRIFLAGFECGGTAAFRVGLQHPKRFAGVLSVGGPFPADGRPLASLRQARHVPLFIAHGRDSRRYPVDRTCAEVRLFHVAGLSVTLRQYPCGDELNTQMLHDINVWLMEQVTGEVSQSSEQPPETFDLN
jgi:phospholipase/carboxylesterase